MTTVEFTPADIRTAALALADSSRRREKGHELHRVSRSLARTFAEHVPTATPALIVLNDEERDLLADSLRTAADAWPAVTPGGHYAHRVGNLVVTFPETLLARLEA